MPDIRTRGDALREYLTGASSDGGAQANPFLSLGHYRSNTEIMSYGITITSPVSSLSVDYVSGGCAPGNGLITVVDADHVQWQDSLSQPGNPAYLPALGSTTIAEAAGNASSYVRLSRISSNPMSGGPGVITLSPRRNNFFGMDNVASAFAISGGNEYLGSMVRNESVSPVTNLCRFVSRLGISQTCVTGLGATGSGTITTSGSFASWPTSGWCRISHSGVLKEIVYYSSRTTTVLTVLLTGRALLGSTAQVGAGSDILDAVPGMALGLDIAGVQAWGNSLQTIADINSLPSVVSWKTGLDSTSGVIIPNLDVGQQIGIWIWRQIPPGVVALPYVLDKFGQQFDAF